MNNLVPPGRNWHTAVAIQLCACGQTAADDEPLGSRVRFSPFTYQIAAARIFVAPW